MQSVKILSFPRYTFDRLLIVCGSCPDQNSDILIDFVEEAMAGLTAPQLHVVAYDCQSPAVNAMLAGLAGITEDSIYHCYTADSVAGIYTSDEIVRLLAELNRCQVS
ncbi:unnamed protein product [Protopolystoma xenopodis]|uniref:Proteasome assembly chaperone 1 n=1 Tax=Protopolystoma xenopodis TaxID=117903 RepID=A0A448WTX5_9PLAT|nr:unnamed protein product [Protopolystoma xenopodis]